MTSLYFAKKFRLRAESARASTYLDYWLVPASPRGEKQAAFSARVGATQVLRTGFMLTLPDVPRSWMSPEDVAFPRWLPLCRVSGVNLHANVSIPARDRVRLERGPASLSTSFLLYPLNRTLIQIS
jgi:hypothetical protein